MDTEFFKRNHTGAPDAGFTIGMVCSVTERKVTGFFKKCREDRFFAAVATVFGAVMHFRHVKRIQLKSPDFEAVLARPAIPFLLISANVGAGDMQQSRREPKKFGGMREEPAVEPARISNSKTPLRRHIFQRFTKPLQQPVRFVR